MDITQRDTFNTAYWKSQPYAVQGLDFRVTPDYNTRLTMATSYMAQGFTIDDDIMINGMDPYLTMSMRANFGFTWVPAAGQPNITIAPGLNAPNSVPYDPDHPPTGSIKVSVDLKDYPSYDGPQTTIAAPAMSLRQLDEWQLKELLPNKVVIMGIRESQSPQQYDGLDFNGQRQLFVRDSGGTDQITPVQVIVSDESQTGGTADPSTWMTPNMVQDYIQKRRGQLFTK